MHDIPILIISALCFYKYNQHVYLNTKWTKKGTFWKSGIAAGEICIELSSFLFNLNALTVLATPSAAINALN